MEAYLIWVVLGFALIIIEMLIGTFYLLVLGIGAFAGGLAAWLGAAFFVQVLSASAVSMTGLVFVDRWRKAESLRNRARDTASNALDVGQPVQFEAWVDEAQRLARVNYRGALWDATVAGGLTPRQSEVLYIVKQEGQMLHVAARQNS